jgi:hypothetical protein
VLFKGLLGEAVEGEGGDGAFEMRGRDAPGAVGATPAGEFITFDPDQAFIYTSTFCVRLGFELGGAPRRNTSVHRARKVDSCPPKNIFYGIAAKPSN